MSDCSCETCGDSLCPGDVLCSSCGDPCDPDKTRGFKLVREMNRGDTHEIEYNLVDSNGGAFDLSAVGVKVWFTVKDYLSRADSQAIWQGTLENGGIVAVGLPTSGMVRVTIPASATALVPDGIVRLYYDLQIKDASARISTIEKGLFEVSPEVTRATS